MKIRKSFGEKVFDVSNVSFLILITVGAMLPILYVIAGSFSSSNALIHNRVFLWPVEATLDNFKLVANNSTFWKAGWMTVQIVVIGTMVNMVLTMITAYPLSKMDLKGRKFFMLLIIFTMIFSAPIIPSYLLVKNLFLLNSIWALILPGAISAFNMILCLTFFRTVPDDLFDAARVDGMSEYGMVWRIVVPLSMPIVMTLLLFYAVGHWNNYFGPLLFINDRNKQTLQMYLYSLIANGDSDSTAGAAAEGGIKLSPVAIQMATIVLATVPVVLIYPFLQKHFVKGALLGSVKE
ncbi:carbohydrate ABC transporter permease [Paenibacillus qinlingensis]|uniref:carbohydrate ABC transporter permease n=1 Tax=Paenibacillus qinlingensis TaxID=1837343 RepID=UPI0015640512|nr:carbohydrate ABC transporter permease [Paenibacillus qinlingensis]NQX60629.1 carbohydrate ABC transporter permease [Paenibacillus qinlingensis]